MIVDRRAHLGGSGLGPLAHFNGDGRGYGISGGDLIILVIEIKVVVYQV